jgi:hypothetical protein
MHANRRIGCHENQILFTSPLALQIRHKQKSPESFKYQLGKELQLPCMITNRTPHKRLHVPQPSCMPQLEKRKRKKRKQTKKEKE